MSGSSTFHNDQRGVSSPLRNSNWRGSPSREGHEASGEEKDEEIACLKRAYHDVVMENSNKKSASSKTNT